MCPLWNDGTGGEKKPTYILPANIGKHFDPNKTFATAAGWTVTNEQNLDEVIVAIGGLNTRLGAATITGIEWGGNFYGGGAATLTVCYNEKIVVTGSPTIAIDKSTGGTITATYASTSKNRLTFNFTVTDGLATTLSVAAQDIALAGGTITDEDGATSEVAISAPVAAALYPTATKVIGINDIVSAVFTTGAFAQGVAKTLTLTYNSPVTVTLTPTISVAFSGVGGAVTASYSSGSGTSALVFGFTTRAVAGTYSLGAQTIAGTGTLKDAIGSTVQLGILAPVAAAAGTKVVA